MVQSAIGCCIVKVKCSRYRPGVAHGVGRGIALLFHDRNTRRGNFALYSTFLILFEWHCIVLLCLMTVCFVLDYVMFDVSRVTCMAGWIESDIGIVIHLLAILTLWRRNYFF